jgi:hypothetical protein
MAARFEEFLQVKLPKGAKQELAKLAARKYETPCSIARQAIMGELEAAGVCLVPPQTKAA